MIAKKKTTKKVATSMSVPANGSVKTLDIKNTALSLLYVILNVPLHGAQSRARNRFSQIIKSKIEVLEDARIDLVESYAQKDEKGNPKMLENGQEYDIDPKDLEKYKAEFNTLMEEYTIIDMVPSVKADFVVIRPIILESKMELQTVDGYMYDEICKAVEAI